MTLEVLRRPKHYIHQMDKFRAFNYEKAALALCPGVKVTGCNAEVHCIGVEVLSQKEIPDSAETFAAFDWDGYGTHVGWSSSKEIIESAVLLSIANSSSI
ncbi:unnamed protein product [Ranitomeya imitator]|uniref:Uncharacterized protein n=1 Tax=Ranitomeya imitator TaxID=111125 RepID=A0ABN9KX40_9NEOB|nr:unnamed protein product [Ranitomeya imitator]